MPLLHPGKVSARRVAANRINALKSTGPRTRAGKQRSRLNALKHGARRNAELEDLVELGEDPRAFEAFRLSLVDTLVPSNAVEAQLVADMAGLWWKKGRADRAQAALQWREFEKLEADRLRHYHETQREPFEPDTAEVMRVGLRGQKECQAKFEEAYAVLDRLLPLVDRGQWTDAEQLCELIYGDKPNWRGHRIREIIAREKGDREEASDPTAPEEESNPEGASPLEPPASPVKELRMLVLRELNDVAVEAHLYRKEFLSITPAARRSCLTPSDPRWPLLFRHEAAMERQIERKLKLYFLIKNSFRRLETQALEELLASASRRSPAPYGTGRRRGEKRRVRDVNLSERSH